MNRFRLMELAQSIRDHADLVEQFATRSDFDNAHLELEVLGRCNQIEDKVSALRGEITRRELSEGQEQMAL